MRLKQGFVCHGQLAKQCFIEATGIAPHALIATLAQAEAIEGACNPCGRQRPVIDPFSLSIRDDRDAEASGSFADQRTYLVSSIDGGRQVAEPELLAPGANDLQSE
jgi:hypothetical protein